MESDLPTPDRLTPRQLEVLELMARGLTNREIAGVLGISAGTVKLHVSAVIDALEVTNRTEAALVLQDFRTGEEEKDPEAVPGFGGRPAIAVLPFDPMTPGEEQRHFADGLVEDLTTRLAAWRWFPVIARNSAFAYQGRAEDVTRIGRELGARYVVEGSARRAGDRVRIHAQLIDASSGEHVFAERFDRRVDDVFAVQDEVVEAIVRALCPALLRFETLRVASRPATSLSTWDRVVRALSHLAGQSEAEIAEAASQLDAVCADEPNLALAHAARAGVAVFEGLWKLGASQRGDLTPEDAQAALVGGLAAFRRAEEGGRRATEIDPYHATAHGALGWGLLLLGRTAESRAALERALELQPSDAQACFALGVLHFREERAEEAIPLLERAIRLSPHDALLHHFLGALAGAHLLRGDFEAALVAGLRSLDVEPANAISYRPAVVATLALLGRDEEARDHLERVLEVAPGFSLEFSRVLAPPRLLERLEGAFRGLGVRV